MIKYLKSILLGLVPMIVGSLIGFGVLSNEITNLKEDTNAHAAVLTGVQGRVASLEMRDAVKMEIMVNLTKAIEKLNIVIETVNADRSETREEVIRIDERLKNIEG